LVTVTAEGLAIETEGGGMQMYSKPEVTDLGSIVEHTFDNPGKGDKSSDTTLVTDKFGEYSHPATS
jgi:hypothetical protein